MQSDDWRAFRDSLAQRLDRYPGQQLLSDLESFVHGRALDDEARGEAAALRGDLLASVGETRAAEESYREAVQLTADGSYARYVIQLVWGDLRGEAGLYLDAIRTALAHGSLPCASALCSLLDAGPLEKLDAADRQLVDRAVEMSWKALRLGDSPPRSTERACRALFETEFRDTTDA